MPGSPAAHTAVIHPAAAHPAAAAKPVPFRPVPPRPPITVPSALTTEAVANAQPWRPVQVAAYAQMSGQLLAALSTYHQECTDAAQIMAVSRALADRVRLDLEAEAWAAWNAKMAVAMGESGDLMTTRLPERQRALSAGYKVMLAAVSEAWAEWHRFMDLAATTVESILAPAQKAYDHRMETAYTTMAAAVVSARENWSRQHNGATQAQGLLTAPYPPGAPPPAA